MGSVPQNRSATNGFHRKSAHQSGGGERGSSRKRSPPETRAPSQPESTPRQRFAGNPHAKAAAEGVLLRRIAGERPSEQRIQRFEAGQARLVQRKKFAGKPRAGAAAEGVPLRRIAGERPSEQRIQRFEAGQARLVQRKSFAGEERDEPAGACPAAAFRREAACWADDSTFRRIVGGTSEQRIQRFEVSQARLVQRKGFAGEECVEPAGAHPAVAFRRGNTRRVRESFALRGWTILRSVESSGVRPSCGFSASKPVRRSSSNGMVLPGKSAEPVGAHPAVAFRRGNARRVWESFAPRGWTILRFVESSGVRPSSGFSASKPVRRGSSSGRSSPGSRAPERRQRAFRFVESPENARQSSGFSASKPGRRGSSRGRVSPGRSAPK